ncbi:MAG: sugar isomerase [Sulfobacillus benefaciens]|uniref:Sugar isomerase n=1 Tax=Sulfobacillus benefaciens TaxID=453960 RepID=A0A2T2WL56_9FIRM|nr:MAG: sugar isomerase [Sulfobacillus benefaciens]
MPGAHVRQLIQRQVHAWEIALPLATPLPFSGPYVFSGSGSSFYLAQTATYFALSLGLEARAVPSTDIMLEPEIALRGQGTLIIISRSGTTTEALWASEQARNSHWPVVAVSCHSQSPLVAHADHAIVSPQGEDNTIVMVQSFSSMLYLLQRVLALTAGNNLYGSDDLHLVTSVFDQASTAVDSLFDANLPRRLYVLGGGVRYGIAQEGALKAQEMSNQCAMAYVPLEFRHGPWGSVKSDDVIVMLGQTRHRRWETELGCELMQRTPHVIGIAQKEWFTSAFLHPKVFLPSTWPDAALGPVSLIPLQTLAWQWTMALGKDPDNPSNITRVVELHDTQFP